MTLPTQFGRLRIPVVGAPMFIVSQPALVIAQCKAGIVGAFPALNARPAPVLRTWITEIRAELAAWDAAHPEAPSAPFAVNQSFASKEDGATPIKRWRDIWGSG